MRINAARLDKFAPSASTEAAVLARKLRAEGHDIVNLSIGQPDFPTPDNVKQAAWRAMENDQTQYTNVGGVVELQDAIREKFRRENGLEYGRDEVIASTGGKQVMFNAFMATMNEGEEAIIPVPYWISYVNQVLLAGGKPVFVPGTGGHDMKLTAEDLASAITPASRWFLFNSPCNPNGAVYTADELLALAEVLRQYPDILIMADEIYEHLIFDGTPHVSIAAVAPDLKDRTLVVNGVSKAYAMTGWRLGYAGGPAPLIQAMVKMQSQNTSCASTISQAAAVEALTGPQDIVEERRAIMQQRRDVIFDALAQTDGLTVHRPPGAMYLFPNCKGLYGRRTPAGKVIENENDLVEYLIRDAGVATVPGGAYGVPGHFRLSFAASMEVLEDGGRRIREACNALT